MASLDPSVFQNFPVLCLDVGLHSLIVLGTWERSAFSSASGSHGSSPPPGWFLLPRLPASLPLGLLCLDESLSRLLLSLSPPSSPISICLFALLSGR